jgi:hypothetical protein
MRSALVLLQVPVGEIVQVLLTMTIRSIVVFLRIQVLVMRDPGLVIRLACNRPNHGLESILGRWFM